METMDNYNGDKINQEIGMRIKRRRTKLGLRQNDVIAALGRSISANSVSRWENGEFMPKVHEFPLLAKILKTSCDYLLTGEGVADVSTDGDSIIKLPFYGDVSAGNFAHSSETREYVSVPLSVLNKSGVHDDCFVLKVNGDSMNKVIANDSMILVERVRSNFDELHPQDVLVIRNGGEFTLKRLRKTETTIVLEPESHLSGFLTQTYKIEDIEDMEVVGRVIMSFQYFI